MAMIVQRWLRRLAPVVGLVALFLPALTFSFPMLGQQRWSAAQMILAPFHTPANPDQAAEQRPSLSQALHQIADLRKQLASDAGASSRPPVVFDLALAIPILLIAAAVLDLVLLVLVWIERRLWRRVTLVLAGLGFLCSAYVLLASWWLTRTLRQEVSGVVSHAQRNVPWINWSQLGTNVASSMGLSAEVAVFLLILVFMVVLLMTEEPPAPAQPA